MDLSDVHLNNQQICDLAVFLRSKAHLIGLKLNLDNGAFDGRGLEVLLREGVAHFRHAVGLCLSLRNNVCGCSA
jgi:hypothetical protein